ncbi:MAG: hypothetical protein JSU98_13090 [Gemmatimonadales bacterium]|nr:MAG: hypothetical protein JSU98_13090 [Gemmatimonadales bacterium]
MSNKRRNRRGFFAELRRRHVVRTALAYAAVVFVVLQLGEIVFPAFQTNAEADALIRVLVVGAVLLFPAVVVVAWVYEITPMGIRSMAEVDSAAGIEPHGSLSHRAGLMAITFAAVTAAAVWWQQTEEWVPVARPLGAASIFQGAQTTDADGPIASMAVLPLEDLSAEPGQEYFAPSMHEALISELSGIDALRVISRTSVLQYQPGGRSLSQIGQDLNVDAIVEGSVLRAEGRVRITVQLIHAASDTHLWSQSYERDLSNVIALQGEVAEAVASQIARLLDERSPGPSGTRLAADLPGEGDADPDQGVGTVGDTGDSAPSGASAPRDAGVETTPAGAGERMAIEELDAGNTVKVIALPAGAPGIGKPAGAYAWHEIDPVLQEAFMRGRVALFQGEGGAGGDAEAFFRTVLEVDSSFVPALAGLAGALLTEAEGPEQVDVGRLEAARRAASRAVALAPDDREAQEMLRSTEEALEAIQGEVAEVRVATPTTQLGQLIQARVARIEVMESPEDSRSGVRSFMRLAAAGRLHEAETLGLQLLAKDVDDVLLWEGLEQIERLQEDAQGLVDLRVRRREVRGREPGGSLRELVSRMEADGAKGYWSWKLGEARARAGEGLPVYMTPVATAHLAMGDREAALEALEEAVQRREPLVATLRHDPIWDVVRADPQFHALMRGARSGVPQ